MSELKLICKGRHCKVFFTRQVDKQFAKADANQRARIRKWMQFFADDGHELLDTGKFKHEGKFSTGQRNGTTVSIWAFKAWQVRVYGGHDVNGDFVATEFDIKQQDAANREKLELAAKKLAEYL
ncbi:hypothetical protein [Brucella intermedia]|uniref:hypothetical protein n=1 Tax=Brucella intermedia TaxID=94625 RepID=UPI000EFA9347|nr:hypothetical protein [Brucella intermedia]KAB2708307.1 hypothetical protein F9K80_14510 [Brucella intermedia]